MSEAWHLHVLVLLSQIDHLCQTHAFAPPPLQLWLPCLCTCDVKSTPWLLTSTCKITFLEKATRSFYPHSLNRNVDTTSEWTLSSQGAASGDNRPRASKSVSWPASDDLIPMLEIKPPTASYGTTKPLSEERPISQKKGNAWSGVHLHGNMKSMGVKGKVVS